MTQLLEYANVWPAFASVLLVFGFLPGFVLRALLLLYPSTSPRRAELLSELYAMPRRNRPMWVAEQIETALWEGPAARIGERRQRRREARRRASSTKFWNDAVREATLLIRVRQLKLELDGRTAPYPPRTSAEVVKMVDDLGDLKDPRVRRALNRLDLHRLIHRMRHEPEGLRPRRRRRD